MNQSTLPPHWKMVLFGEVAKTYISGGTPTTKDADLWNGEVAWTTSAPIIESDVSLHKAQRFISIEAVKKSATNLVPRGNLLVGTRVGVGKAVVNEIDISISQDLTGVLIDEQRADATFLAYYFKLNNVQNFISGRKRGTTIKGISRLDLHSVPLLLPPLPEQRAIASTLKAVQDAKEARRRELKLERERKAALMQHLFTYGTRGEPLKDTEIGKMPQSWEVVKLGAIAEIQSGSTPSRTNPKFYGGSIRWVKTLDLNESFVNDTEEHITESGLKSIRGKMRPVDTVMVGMYGGAGTVGKSGILGQSAATNQAVCCIEPNPQIFDSLFLLH